MEHIRSFFGRKRVKVIPEYPKEEPTLDSLEKQIVDLNQEMIQRVREYVETTEKLLEKQSKKNNITLVEVANTKEHLEDMRKIVIPQ